MAVLEDFEGSSPFDKYTTTGTWGTQTSEVYEGTTSGSSEGETSAVDTDTTVGFGDTPFGGWAYYPGGTLSGAYIAFGVQSETSRGSLNCYLVGNDGYERIYRVDNGSLTELAGGNTYVDEGAWFKFVVTTWDSNGNISLEIRDINESLLASVSATDTNHGEGGWGWYYNQPYSSDPAYFDYWETNIGGSSNPPAQPTDLNVTEV